MPKKELPQEAPVEIRKIVEGILGEKFGCVIRVDAGEPIRGGMFRFQILEGSNNSPVTVFSKQKGKESSRRHAIFNEWAGLQLLTECYDGSGPAPMPLFYGGDCEHYLVVMEDLGREHRFLGHDAELARRALVDFGRSLGKIQCMTIGKRERYEEIYQSIGHGLTLTPPDRRDYSVRIPPDYTMGMQDNLHEHYVDMFLNLCYHIDVIPHPDTQRELESIRSYLTDPEDPFLTLTHEDIYAVNVMYHQDDLKIVDFELSQFRHALSDGIKCWTALDGWTNQNLIPDDVEQEMIQAYRMELGKGCSQANDDETFYREVVKAAVIETVMGIYRRQSPEQLFEMKDRSEQDQMVHDSRCWRLIHRCRLLSKLTDSVGYLQGIGETARRVEKKCRDFWPDHVFEIPMLPAFRQKNQEN